VSITDYAVVDPATGETIKTYETIGDDALRDAIARAHPVGPRDDRRGAGKDHRPCR
jgi:acyl-CoA reductase-like NAD-dependent aldehyde dehydrogenase